MAGFRTHVTTSSVLGVAYGAGAWHFYDVPAPTCVLAAGLCGVSGMLPDLDSGPGVPLRESVAFAAAVVPMLMVHRMHQMDLAAETMVLVGAGVYLGIRFGVSRLLKWYTVHRGMFHSIPGALIAAELGFLLSFNPDVTLRLYKAGAILVGFMSHLVLDEIYSVEFKYGFPRFKSSFGTAVKLWGKNTWANFSCYGKLAILTWLVFHDPSYLRDAAKQAYRGQPIPRPGQQGSAGATALAAEGGAIDEATTSDSAGGKRFLTELADRARGGWDRVTDNGTSDNQTADNRATDDRTNDNWANGPDEELVEEPDESFDDASDESWEESPGDEEDGDEPPRKPDRSLAERIIDALFKR
jgi:hypothetical protein